MVFVLLGTKSRSLRAVETETYTTDLARDATCQRGSRNKYEVATYEQLKQSHIWQTKPIRFPIPCTWRLRVCLVGCRSTERWRMGSGELALLIQLMNGLSSENSWPSLSASKFLACLISPLNVSREKA